MGFVTRRYSVVSQFLIVIILFFSSSALSGYPAQTGKPTSTTFSFIDSATGYSVNPQRIEVKREAHEKSLFTADGRGRSLISISGSSSVTVDAKGYKPVFLTVTPAGRSLTHVVFLTPLHPPDRLRSEYLNALRSPDAMLIAGYVVDDNSGLPLAGVEVVVDPSLTLATTDATGFFIVRVKLPQTGDGDLVAKATIRFQKHGFRSERLVNLEFWPHGEWTMRIRLVVGDGERVQDEAPRPQEEVEQSTVERQTRPWPIAAPIAPRASQTQPTVAQLASSTVRVPLNIRVSYGSSSIAYVPFDYQCDGCLSYVASVLPAEWPQNYGDLNPPLGMNSLLAGAVAIRSYATFFFNNPPANYNGAYDICGTMACQVFDPTKQSTNSDFAVRQTLGVVLANTGGVIVKTEFARENNDHGCGDGYSGDGSADGPCMPDPVCAGVPTDSGSHGRGMCQNGSARWASGYYNIHSTPPVTNGYPPQSWDWILRHYYPILAIYQGQPLLRGDRVRVFGRGSSALPVRACAGVSCSLLGTQNEGAVGTIVSGPVRILTDGYGYTWWQVQWDLGGLTGWSAENWLSQATSSGAGTIEVNATLDGVPWPGVGTGILHYTLSGPTPLSTSIVPVTFGQEGQGIYTLSYTSDGPTGIAPVSITPASSQTLAASGKITFTLNFVSGVACRQGNALRALNCPPPSDTIPPETIISAGPSGLGNSPDISFSWTGSDNATPTSSLVYAFRLDPVDSGYSTFGDATTHSYSNLPNGSYTFFVKARDEAGNEDPSPATRSFTVASGAAPSVASVAASEISMTDGYLNAFVNPNGSSTNVFFQYGLTSNYGLTTPSKSLGMGTGTLAASWNVTGLSCHTTYNFRAAATNAYGTNYGDNLSFTTSACGTTPTPPAVTTTAASNVTANSATVNASVNPEGKSTSYHFEYGTSTSYGLSTSSQSLAGDNSSHAVSFVLSGLTCGTLYDFRVVASNADGTNGGNNQSLVTDPCSGGGTSAPTVTTRPADGIDIADANLESTVNPDGEDTYLFFEYGLGTDYGSTTPSRHIEAGTTNIGIGTRITGLPCSTLYNYRAVATNADGTARGDNLTFSTASCGVDTELVNGVSRTDSVSSPVAGGAWNFYYITVPQDAVQLHVYVANLSGDVLVLANSGSKPLFTAFSCEGAIGGTDPRRCTVENPTPGVWWIGVSNLDTGTITYTITATVAESSGAFFTLYPCRIVDSRNGPRGSLGGSSGVNTPITGFCGIPATATAVSLNVTATRPSSAGFISVTDAVGLPASTSTVNFSRGQTRANNAIVKLTPDGTVAVYCGGMGLSGSVDFILDTNGYFVDQRPLVGVWRGTFASYTAELDIEKNGNSFMAQFSAAGNPKTDMTILSISDTDFDALRPSDHNAEVRLSLTPVGTQSCLVGGYIESGVTRPVSVCLVE